MLTTTVCAALSAAGLAVAFLTAWRRRFVAATRIAAVSLLPVGLAMSGLVGLAGKIGKAVGTWAADLVLKPTVWAGFGVLACAVVLYVIARFASGRAAGSSGAGRKERRAAARADQRQATEPAAGAPSLGSGASQAPANPPAKAKKPGSSGGDEDFSDIEAILKKHGI
ncbi:hypothetical protein [Streptomyces iconiensis]|uniref:Cellulose synthase n=1 Tax=Streptomyces iconiensis TaxID=1384038 RepID=A0ABT6ZTD3_9ACTN|nr:hypothetical protein [Streptomyces iconiensis]MDJ1132323.1 hypothetical protein [Streptomyces iconiensis]